MVDGTEGPCRLTRDEIRQRIAEITYLRLSGDIERFIAHFAADVTVHYNCEKAHLFNPGVLYGAAAFRQNIQQVEEVYRGVADEILDVLIEDQRAWVRWRTRWRHIGAGAVYDLDMAYFLRWRGDKVVELHEFFDTPVPSAYGRALVDEIDDLVKSKPAGLTRAEILELVEFLAKLPTTCGSKTSLFRQHCAPGVVSEFVGDRKRIPYAGRHCGVDALMAIVQSIAVDFEQLNYRLEDIVIDENRVALRRSVDWRHRGTGRRGVVALAEFLRFENGLIAELIEFRDSVTMVRMGE
ncbi:MAG TPA: nuclear transport factor 2 family protein [Methylocystis sp.]|nr:nuclear transport factor 2 family protein [Methylocystis sp.]